MKKVLMTICFCILLVAGTVQSQEVAQHLQDVSVTIRAAYCEGSGVIVTRTIGNKKVNFIWTAAHVVAGLRKVESVVTPDGTERKIISFDDCSLVKELIEGGRKVGEVKMAAVVIRYSAKEDLALLQIRKFNFISANAEFYLEETSSGEPKIPRIGSALFHVGSLLGQAGCNSMTSGIVSQIGRVYPGIGKEVFDQTTVAAFPGSSGGGVYLEDGRYIGMLVRGAGETFNLIVPVRRMLRWAKSANVEWALNTAIDPPSLQEIEAMPIEDVGHKFLRSQKSQKEFPYLIIIKEDK